MNENLFKEWIRSIAGTASKPHPFNSSSDRIIKSSSFTSPGPGSYDVPNKDTRKFMNKQKGHRNIMLFVRKRL